MFSHIKELFTRPSGYRISRSVRLRSSASAYFNRSVATTSATHLWAYSGWLKRGTFGADVILFGAGSSSTEYTAFYFDSSNRFNFVSIVGGVIQSQLISTPVYRDPSHYYHIAFFYESGNATSTNRLRLYVNGVQVTAFTTATYPTLNLGTYINNSVTGGNHVIGKSPFSAASYFDGYLTEINFIDGQALTPSSFGENDAVTGVWKPKKYAGTYGTNGFYLNFSDNSAATAAAIGKDYSGNSNNWTPNNISVTAGATYDSMLDVPTLYADGGNGRGNYCVASPVNYRTTTPTPTITDGNLKWIGASASISSIGCASMGVSTGKWYWEVTRVGTNTGFLGVVNGQFNATTSSAFDLGYNSNEYAYISSGNKVNNNSSTAYGASYTSGDVIGVALDLNAGTLTFYKNNTSQGTAYSGLSLGDYWTPAFDSFNGAGFTLNFGQQPFTYTPPTGFVALNTQNLPTPTISNGASYMAATTYDGNGSSQILTNTVNSVSFQPDFVWVKKRSGATNHYLWDSVRGALKEIYSNLTNAESTNTIGLSAFNSNGFTLNNGDSAWNASGSTYVGWQWKASGTTSSNTNGSITSTVSVNATAGFSIVTASASGTSPVTMGHGLGVAPSFIIGRVRNNTANWYVYSSSFSSQDYLVLNTTAAKATSSNIWDSAPTSTVLTVGNPQNGWNGGTVGSYNYVLYCWAQVAGFSKFGSYTGNGSADGPFVYCGFRPRFLLWKRTDAVANWFLLDSTRTPANPVNLELYADQTNAETTFTDCDFLSNGFKLRTSNTDRNASGGTYIYAAFAENPFKLSLAR